MEINFINSRREEELIEVVDAEIELTDTEIKQLLETPGYRFESHADMKHIDHIIIKSSKKN